MIFPVPPKMQDLDKSLITMCLLGINLFFFYLLFLDPSISVSSKIQEQDLRQAGYVVQNIKSKPTWYAAPKTDTDLVYLGAQAVRSLDWDLWIQEIENSKKFDPVALESLKTKRAVLIEEMQIHSLARFGLQQKKNQFLTFLTYQFSHASFWHLLSNSLFLLVFGLLVERAVGGTVLLGLYLISGVFAAQFFLFFAENSISPLVGASGSVSGLIGFYLIYEKRKKIPAFFLPLMFKQNYFENRERLIVYVPKWIFFFIFLLTDFTAVLSQPSGWGEGVAHLAHIGGALIGMAIGLFCRIMKQSEFVNFEIIKKSSKLE